MKSVAFLFRTPAVLPALLVGVSWAVAAEAQNSPSPRVVASIKPIHSLVAGVMVKRRPPANIKASSDCLAVKP